MYVTDAGTITTFFFFASGLKSLFYLH